MKQANNKTRAQHSLIFPNIPRYPQTNPEPVGTITPNRPGNSGEKRGEKNAKSNCNMWTNCIRKDKFIH